MLNIERAAEPSNVTSKALEQVLSNAIRNAMNPIQKVSPVFTTPAINCQPMFMTPAPLTLSGQQPGFSGYFNQKPAPKYNMGLQKEISQIQVRLKTLKYQRKFHKHLSFPFYRTSRLHTPVVRERQTL